MMWAWWLIFLLFAGLFGYVATWFIISSRKFFKQVNSDDDEQTSISKPLKSPFKSVRGESSMHRKIQEIESKVNQYSSRQFDVLAKLEQLQQTSTAPNVQVKKQVDSENEWEEMYYEVRDRKEELEEQVEQLNVLLLEKQQQVMETEQNDSHAGVKSSKTETEELEKNNLYKLLDLMEKKIEASMKREMELTRELSEKETQLDAIKFLRMQNADLSSQLEEMKIYIDSLRTRNNLAELGKSRVAELQYQLHNKEDEKENLLQKFQDITKENEKLQEKLKELQKQLHDEAYRAHLPGSKN